MLFTKQDGFITRIPPFGHPDPKALRISDFPAFPSPSFNDSFSYSQDLQLLLCGRSLLMDEVPFNGELVHEHYLHGYVSYGPGVQAGICQRCGNGSRGSFGEFECARCGKSCRYCRNCLMMGRVSECTPLLTWNGPPPRTKEDVFFAWEGTLSPAQQEASTELVTAVKEDRDLLIWAVCGAGKTEVLFEGIHEAIRGGKRVCLATPRTDVILELSPRLKKVFPETDLITLYGGSEERQSYGQIVLTTTHQLFRFKEAFDVMIVDEVDAFPYSFDSSLQFAVEKARKPSSSLIHLTATPDGATQRECRSGRRHHFRIPARFHRHPIPPPRFAWCGNWQKSLEKGKIPPPLKKWTLQRLHTSTPALIFFPSVAIMNKALSLFKAIHPLIESVHAEDPERKEKVMRMRKFEMPILLTTTILERGVTIPGIDVAVLGAEETIFTESALVQISGRVGRSSDHPGGDIVYFHHGKTGEMIKARAHIHDMNREAGKRGLIDAT